MCEFNTDKFLDLEKVTRMDSKNTDIDLGLNIYLDVPHMLWKYGHRPCASLIQNDINQKLMLLHCCHRLLLLLCRATSSLDPAYHGHLVTNEFISNMGFFRMIIIATEGALLFLTVEVLMLFRSTDAASHHEKKMLNDSEVAFGRWSVRWRGGFTGGEGSAGGYIMACWRQGWISLSLLRQGSVVFLRGRWEGNPPCEQH